MSDQPPPLRNSYWVEPGRILGGEYPGGGRDADTVLRLGRLRDAGIDCFIDLTEPGECSPYEPLLRGPHVGERVRYLRRAIPDHGLPESAERMQEILDDLDAALADGHCVYLHCRAGIGRTNLVAGCWFASKGQDGDRALARLNERWQGSERSETWPTVPETDAQSDFVRGWRSRVSPVQVTAMPAAAAAVTEAAPAFGVADRLQGLLLGLAAADAEGHASHGMPVGAWDGRMAMALCLAESLVARRGHDPADQVQRYQSWQRAGRWSSTGSAVGISAATVRALATAQWTGNPYAGSHDPAAAAAEPLTRIGPAVAWYRADARQAVETAVNCARVTHQAPLTLDAVRYLAALIAGALAGEPKEALLAPMYAPQPGFWDRVALKPRVREVAEGSWRGRRPRAIVVDASAAATALEGALHAFHAGHDVRGCIAAAAERGGAAMDSAAIVGQLAGAYYGASNIAAEWRATIARHGEIVAMADALAAGGAGPGA